MTTTEQLSYLSERQALSAAATRLFAAGVMSNSGHMNLSTSIDNGGIILADGTDIEHMTVIRGDTPETELPPATAEIIQMHTKVYEVRPDVHAIIHTHSPHLLAFAMANEPLPDRYEALLRWGQAEEIPVVPWAPRGSDRSVSGIVELAQSRSTTKAVLLGNHGVLVFGPDPMATANLLIVMEEAAAGELSSSAIGGAKDFPEGALEETRASIARGAAISQASRH